MDDMGLQSLKEIVDYLKPKISNLKIAQMMLSYAIKGQMPLGKDEVKALSDLIQNFINDYKTYAVEEFNNIKTIQDIEPEKKVVKKVSKKTESKKNSNVEKAEKKRKIKKTKFEDSDAFIGKTIDKVPENVVENKKEVSNVEHVLIKKTEFVEAEKVEEIKEEILDKTPEEYNEELNKRLDEELANELLQDDHIDNELDDDIEEDDLVEDELIEEEKELIENEYSPEDYNAALNEELEELDSFDDELDEYEDEIVDEEESNYTESPEHTIVDESLIDEEEMIEEELDEIDEEVLEEDLEEYDEDIEDLDMEELPEDLSDVEELDEDDLEDLDELDEFDDELEEDDEEESEVSEIQEILEPTLFLIDGPNGDETFTLSSGAITIGRSQKCDIVLKDKSVSRKHARVVFTRNKYYIADLNSGNGLFINGVKIEKSVLRDKDEIQVGDLKLIFRLPL